MPKVMIVDDDRTTTGLLQTLLELDGFEVVTTGDPDSALQQATSILPDAFLIDFYLADKEGTTFVRQIRQHAALSGVPVIMTSGLDHEQDALDAGANLFLIKPFEPSQLIVELNRLIHNT
ncbi:MAG: response regulator [Chloroflexi bacterium]|nr:response regulator [Chloroflexota bacterium]